MILDIKPASNLICTVLCNSLSNFAALSCPKNLKLHPFYNFHLPVTFIPNAARELTFLVCSCQGRFVAQRDSLSSA